MNTNTKTKQKTVNNTETQTFRSLKNNCEFEDVNDEIRRLMLVSEFDTTVDSYKPFDLALVSTSDFNNFDTYSGLIIDSDDDREFIIVSDKLANNKFLGGQVAELIQRNEGKQIRLQVCPEDSLEKELIVDNVEYIYKFALLPQEVEVFDSIKNILEFIEETTLGELKRCIKNDTAIYQLMFHQAIRADLGNNNINDDLVVYASPLINSIIRELTNV